MVARLVPVEKPARPERRAWLIFFSDGNPGRFSLPRLLTGPGFRHVAAASYFADEDRWVFVNPSRDRIIIEIRKPADAGEIYDDMLARASYVLRFEARADRSAMPALICCVGAVKALLGIRSRALLPISLFRDLVREGAEILPLPREGCRVVPDPEAKHSAAAGRPRGEAAA